MRSRRGCGCEKLGDAGLFLLGLMACEAALSMRQPLRISAVAVGKGHARSLDSETCESIAPISGWGETCEFVAPISAWGETCESIAPISGWGETCESVAPISGWGETCEFVAPISAWGETCESVAPISGLGETVQELAVKGVESVWG